MTQEQEGLKGEPVPQILLGLCNPDTQSSVWATLPLTRSERGGANPRAWATLFGQYGVGRVCASEKSAAASFCPLSPAIGLIAGKQRHCGGEGWGEGVTPPALGPSPRPSPHSHVPSESLAARGERGQRTTAADFSVAHTRAGVTAPPRTADLASFEKQESSFAPQKTGLSRSERRQSDSYSSNDPYVRPLAVDH